MVDKLSENKYFIWLGKSQKFFTWNIWDESFCPVPECDYIGKILRVLDKKLPDSSLTFYLTTDVYKLPSYGKNVVVILYADEGYRFPAYAHDVLAVFKWYGTQLPRGCNPLLHPSYLNVLSLLQFFFIWLARIPSLVTYRLHQIKQLITRNPSTPHIYDFPLGYYRQLDLPIKELDARTYDICFNGSVKNRPYPIWTIKHWMKSPKTLSRQQMIRYLGQIQEKYPALKIECRTTAGFVPGVISNNQIQGISYSEEMMDTRICLVPRGTRWETHRFFEGLRYGCILITEFLPAKWFYEGSPVIQINDWRELEPIVTRLVNDPIYRSQKHHEALEWWDAKCSETAVAHYMISTLEKLWYNQYSCLTLLE